MAIALFKVCHRPLQTTLGVLLYILLQISCIGRQRKSVKKYEHWLTLGKVNAMIQRMMFLSVGLKAAARRKPQDAAERSSTAIRSYLNVTCQSTTVKTVPVSSLDPLVMHLSTFIICLEKTHL